MNDPDGVVRGGTEPTPLEDRYGRLLRLLPVSYRARWGKEMVATFRDSIDAADPEEAQYVAEHGRPTPSEVASVIGLAVRLRLGGAESPPRSYALGEAVRRVALVGLLVHAVGATVMVAQDLWIAGMIPWPPVPGRVAAMAPSFSPDPMHVGLNGAWVAAYVALVSGAWRTAKALAAVAFAPAVVATLGASANLALGADSSPLVLTRWAQFALVATVLLALAAFHRDAPPVRPRPWLVAYAVGLPVMAALTGVALFDPMLAARFLDQPGVWSAALVAAGLVHVGRRRNAESRPATEWALALTVLAVGVTGLRATSLLDYVLADALWVDATAIAVGILETVAVLVVGVALGCLAGQALRTLPPPAARPGGGAQPAP